MRIHVKAQCDNCNQYNPDVWTDLNEKDPSNAGICGNCRIGNLRIVKKNPHNKTLNPTQTQGDFT